MKLFVVSLYLSFVIAPVTAQTLDKDPRDKIFTADMKRDGIDLPAFSGKPYVSGLIACSGGFEAIAQIEKDPQQVQENRSAGQRYLSAASLRLRTDRAVPAPEARKLAQAAATQMTAQTVPGAKANPEAFEPVRLMLEKQCPAFLSAHGRDLARDNAVAGLSQLTGEEAALQKKPLDSPQLLVAAPDKLAVAKDLKLDVVEGSRAYQLVGALQNHAYWTIFGQCMLGAQRMSPGGPDHYRFTADDEKRANSLTISRKEYVDTKRAELSVRHVTLYKSLAVAQLEADRGLSEEAAAKLLDASAATLTPIYYTGFSVDLTDTCDVASTLYRAALKLKEKKP